MNKKFVTFETIFSVPLKNGLTRPKAVRGLGIKFINMGELFSYDRIFNMRTDRVQVSEKESHFLLEKFDLLFARQSLVLSGAGKCSIFLADDEPYAFESHLIRARLNSDVAYSPFFFYFFNSSLGREGIESIVEQVAAAGIRGSDLAQLPIPLPPLPTQKAIAHILNTLDDKIELLRQMNETLEAMAKALFQSWFVDFDPVRKKAEGIPTGLPKEIEDLFPSEFEESELGEIPKGWKVGKLGDVADNINIKAHASSFNGIETYVGLEHIPRNSISLSSFGKSADVQSDKSRFVKNDILFGKLRPYFHKVVFAPLDGICSTDILVIRPKVIFYFGFVLMHVSSKSLIEHTTNCSNGTRMPRTNWGDVSKFEVPIPNSPNSILENFNFQIDYFTRAITANNESIDSLSSLRDSLLPKLISGELELSDKMVTQILEQAK